MTLPPDGPPRPLPRVRVTRARREFPMAGDNEASPEPAPEAPVAAGEVGGIYLRTLFRAQLRLAVTMAVLGGLGVLTITGVAVVIAAVPALTAITAFGVPVSWVVQAYGMYPMFILLAGIYMRAASRNEKRYRLLEQSG